jgi:hypothetical protein
MTLPQVYELTSDEVRQAFAEWVTSHRLQKGEPLQTVSVTITVHPNGTATVTLGEPLQ